MKRAARAGLTAAIIIFMFIIPHTKAEEPQEDTTIIITQTAPETQTTAAETPEPKPTETSAVSRYSEIELSEADIETLARLTYLEARGEPFEGQVAVVEVVLNRILSEYFPDTVSEVVYQKNQFSPAGLIGETTPTEEQYEAVYTAIGGQAPVTDEDVVYFSCAPYNNRVFMIIGNHYFCRI